jgi:hypothetical protein
MQDVREYAYNNFNSSIVDIKYRSFPNFTFTPICMDRYLKRKRKTKQLKFELYKQAINYCYWQLKDGNFTKWEAHGLKEAHAMETGMLMWIDGERDFDVCFPNIPLKEERIAALYDLQFRRDKVEEICSTTSAHALMKDDLRELFPTAFGGDPFRKREILFKLVAFDIIADSTMYLIKGNFPVAADYQLPRILRHLGILEYSEELAHKVDNYIPIESGSKEELALRSATVIACDALSIYAALPLQVMDSTLWVNRNLADKPFHLTETTSY